MINQPIAYHQRDHWTRLAVIGTIGASLWYAMKTPSTMRTPRALNKRFVDHAVIKAIPISSGIHYKSMYR